LGGVENNIYKDLQKIIDKMLQIGVDVDDINQSSFYKELVRNVKHNCYGVDILCSCVD